ncbi:MAG: DUF5107 domain-containing protein [Eubacteriales bacterium]|nr:DUF5107 domain-containing protein [Eubacteriales bacterium]
MSKAYIKIIKMPVNVIEKSSPYPDMSDTRYYFKAGEGLENELFLDKGTVKNIFPYTMQDIYSTELVNKKVKTVVLENKYIKAVFLPEYGARLMSIYDKTKKKDIVYNNDAIRITNIALRNAWFAGGVEWNSGMRGHTPFTCDNVFCEIIENGEEPVLRFYEWERIRKQFFEVCAYLPNESRQLFVKVRLINCKDEENEAYWWSNIAIEEKLTTRVITNCDDTYAHNYSGEIVRIPVPYRGRTDITYPTRNQEAVDYFFKTFDDRQRFVMTAEDDGNAFYQTSTNILKSRKEFVWGMNMSSFNWQRALVGTNNAYLEVQAGLANTQMEYLPMPANAEWEWTEAYGMTTVDTEKIFSDDWTVAREEGARAVESELNDEQLLKAENEIKKICKKQGELVHKGSAWASLESKINYSKWYDMFAQIPLEDEQKPWLELIETGKFVCPDKVRDNPAGYIYDKKLKALLEKCTDNWYAYFHLGLMYFYEEDIQNAKDAFEKSLSIKENPWAYYALSQLYMECKDYKTALANIKKAYKFNKKDIRILKELYRCASAAGKSDEYIKVYEKLPQNIKDISRIKLCLAGAYLDIGDIDAYEKLMSIPFRLCDIREGEASARTVWKKYLELKYMTDEMSEQEREKIVEMYTIPHWMDY